MSAKVFFVNLVIMLLIMSQNCNYFLKAIILYSVVIVSVGSINCWANKSLRTLTGPGNLNKLHLKHPMIKQMLSLNIRELYWKQNLHQQAE